MTETSGIRQNVTCDKPPSQRPPTRQTVRVRQVTTSHRAASKMSVEWIKLTLEPKTLFREERTHRGTGSARERCLRRVFINFRR